MSLDEFIAALAETRSLFRWSVREGALRGYRATDPDTFVRCFCPLTAVLRLRALQVFSVHFAGTAAAELGLTPVDAQKIICAADIAGGYDTTLRARLLAAVGLAG